MLNGKIYILLFAIVIFAAFLRFYNLSSIPVSLYWDEVSSAYNAYSLLQTGRDEFGNKFPLLFHAFEDYKTPANIYLTAIAIKIFGLNEFSARFTSAFFGTLTVLISFFLAKEIIKKKIFEVDPAYIALLATTLLAISPWHIQFSRAGFEANSGLFFVVLGAFLLFKYLNTKSYKFLFASISSYAFSIYFYRSIWIFVPLFLFSFFLINFNVFFSKQNIKGTLLAIILFIVLLLPFIPVMLSHEGMVRSDQVSVVNNSSEKVYEFAKKIEATGEIGKIIYNRRIVYALEIGQNYLSHFSPNFLFINGDGNGRHGVKGVGILYIWAILFIIPGLFALKKLERKTAYVLTVWIAIAIIPAAIAIPSPHALRSLNMIPIPQIILALGIVAAYAFISKKFRPIFIVFMGGVIIYSFLSYASAYFVNSKKVSSDWADGYKQLTSYVFANENRYDKVIVSGHYWQPYVYFLFYKKYDPKLFQESGSKTNFDKYIFGGTGWDKDINRKELGEEDLEKLSGTKKYIVALSPEEYLKLQEKLVVVDEIRNHNNEVVFLIAKPK